METMLSKELQAGLDAARQKNLRKSSRLRLDVGGRIFPVLRLWKTGFAISAQDAPQLRGLVDIYDGAHHMMQCLVIRSAEEADEMHYEFKRATAVAEKAALDFEQDTDKAKGLISDQR